MGELSYSFHIGSDKNRRKSANKKAKSNSSKSTSLSNNGIQNATQLSKVSRHNLEFYDRRLIQIIEGTSDLYKDTQDLYKKEFEESRIEYNNNQAREDRKIKNYFRHISDSSNRDLACEVIIQLGDMEFWKDKSKEECYKMVEVFKEQIKDLSKVVPEFKLANATIHFDESSPHLHIVGVPIKDGYKNGMKKQVAKSLVFTKSSLKIIQDKMRECCINSFNKTYKTNHLLKEKEIGRNKDVNVKDMPYYKDIQIKELKKELKQVKEIVAEQKEEIKGLTKQVLFFKNLWVKLKRFFRNKACYNKNETYEKVTKDLHENQLFTKEDMDQIMYGQPIPDIKTNKNLER